MTITDSPEVSAGRLRWMRNDSMDKGFPWIRSSGPSTNGTRRESGKVPIPYRNVVLKPAAVPAGAGAYFAE